MKKAVFILILLLSFEGVAGGQEIKPGDTKEPPKYREFKLEPGYTFFSTDNNPTRVNEFSRSRSSAFFSGSFNDLSPQNKFITAFDVYGKDDRYLDFNWYYKDKLKLQLSDINFVHNLDHNTLLVNPAMYDQDLTGSYNVNVEKRFLALKYKPFSDPFHLRFYLEELDKGGTFQKIFYGSRSLDPVLNTSNIFSRPRDIRFETNRVLGSADWVWGGVGFFVRADSTSFSNKIANTPDGLIKYPELTRNSQMVKLYSNSTGKVAWALYLNRINAENNNRDETGSKKVEYTYTNSTALLSYNPLKTLKMSLRLNYEDRSEDNPNSIRFNSVDSSAKDAVSYVRKTAALNAKYYLSPNWSMKLNLKRKETERGANNFLLPESSYTNTGIIGIDGKINKSLTLNLSQKAENNRNPYYNGTPENLYATRLNLVYDINDRAGIDFIWYYTNETNSDAERFFRENKTHSYTLTYWYNPAKDIGLNFYANYETEKYRSDLVLGTTDRDTNVPYRASTIQSGVNTTLNLNKNNIAYADLFYFRGYGTYHPHIISGTYPSTTPYDTTELSHIADTNFYQHGLVIGDRIKFSNNSSLRIEAGYRDHEEKTDSSLSGTVKTVFVSWEQRW